MKDELIGRLEVAKASAEKYPDSYVLVTGGVEKNGWTEGQRMKDWLIAEGIDEERIVLRKRHLILLGMLLIVLKFYIRNMM